MRNPLLLAAVTAFAALLPSIALAQSGSGTLWEIRMQMEGMPAGMDFGMPSQRTCMSNDPAAPPPADEGCTILEQSSSGNRHRARMQCPDGLMEIDQTRTATSMKSKMKMTDKSGEVTEMTLVGKVVGQCDYQGDKQAREKQMAELQRQADAAQKQSAAQLAVTCKAALDKMQGTMFGKDTLCPQQKKEFCRRLDTLEGYRSMAGAIPAGAENVEGYRSSDQVANCGLDDATLRAKHCRGASGGADFGFVGAFCPQEAARLCPQAAAQEQFAYLFRHCPAEKEAFVGANCAGRKYSSQIDARYRELCVGELGAEGFGNDGSAAPKNPADAVETGVKQGVKGLKKVFGF